jgi:16S rRNA (adenine1518-N6/adenine1519-N6)-dimethyltransferase
MGIQQNIKLLIEKYRIFPLEKLGQNFLINRQALNLIVETINPDPQKTYIEIGPGFLHLTNLMAERAKEIFAIEKDKRFKRFYDEIASKNIKIIFADALKTDLSVFDACEVYGNIPYYISSDLIIKIGKNTNIKRAIFLLQKEYAKRVLSYKNSKQYSSLTIVVDFFFNKNYIKTFSPNSFYPKPSIHSTLIELNRKYDYQDINTQDFLKFIKTAFSMRRKKLYNNLKKQFEERNLLIAMEKASINLDARAENLDINEYIRLYNFLSKNIF